MSYQSLHKLLKAKKRRKAYVKAKNIAKNAPKGVRMEARKQSIIKRFTKKSTVAGGVKK